MNYLAIAIGNNPLILITTNLSAEALKQSLDNSLKYHWKDHMARVENNYFLLNPEKYTGDEKKRPVARKQIYNEWFKVADKELSLSQFFDFETKESRYWTILTLEVSKGGNKAD